MVLKKPIDRSSQMGICMRYRKNSNFGLVSVFSKVTVKLIKEFSEAFCMLTNATV